MTSDFKVGEWIKATFTTKVPTELNRMRNHEFPSSSGVKEINVTGQIVRFHDDIATVQCRSRLEHVPIDQMKPTPVPRWAKEARKDGR